MSCSADIAQYQSLKRPKFGPPDVYPQHKDQNEDKLNDQTLKRVTIFILSDIPLIYTITLTNYIVNERPWLQLLLNLVISMVCM